MSFDAGAQLALLPPAEGWMNFRGVFCDVDVRQGIVDCSLQLLLSRGMRN